MRIALITEAWPPQVSGVVTTWTTVVRWLEAHGHEVLVIHPELFATVPCPRYPAVRLALKPAGRVRALLDEFEPQAIHIATEGPIGLAGRRYCVRHSLAFTTSYHTQFPDYLKRYFGFPRSTTYSFLRWFHAPAKATLIPTASLGERLSKRGFTNLAVWTRGVDHDVFRPAGQATVAPGQAGQLAPSETAGNRGNIGAEGPVFLCAGRVSLEKNLPAFLDAELPGSKVIVGDGPALPRLRRQYPHVTFTGYLPQPQFVQRMASADVFVFPSLTETFGIVMIEAMACGVPVAAYPVTGPKDVLTPGQTGVLDEDLSRAALAALKLDRTACREASLRFTWTACAQQVLQTLVPVR